MSLFVYNLSILLFRMIVRISSLFNGKAALFVEGRKRIFIKLGTEITGDSPIIWFHCASLGEFEQGRPVISAVKKYFPNHKILITFFSPSGYEVRKNYDGADYIYYLPFDTLSNANRFIKLVNPRIAIFIKYEFWHHYISILKQKNIPILSISAVFRPNQIYFRSYGRFYARILKSVSHLFTQDDYSKELLKTIDINQVTVSGDTRFDRVEKIKEEDHPNPLVEQFCGTSKVVIIGSSWKEDHELLLPYINGTSDDIKFIIAPHEIQESQISLLEKGIKLKGIRYSLANPNMIEGCRFMIIDSIGILAQLYKYGHFAYIGGAFGAGLHNILEAAAFGLPLFFGDKNYQKFREANELIELGGAAAISTTKEFEESLIPLLDEGLRKDLSGKIVNYMTRNTGATEIIMKYITKELK